MYRRVLVRRVGEFHHHAPACWWISPERQKILTRLNFKPVQGHILRIHWNVMKSPPPLWQENSWANLNNADWSPLPPHPRHSIPPQLPSNTPILRFIQISHCGLHHNAKTPRPFSPRGLVLMRRSTSPGRDGCRQTSLDPASRHIKTGIPKRLHCSSNGPFCLGRGKLHHMLQWSSIE